MSSKKFSYKIITDNNRLIERSNEINIIQENQLARKIASALKDTLKTNKDIVALCAPQLGDQVRIFAIKFSNKDIRVFANPMITKREGLHLSRETNPSILNKEFIMLRNDKIILAFQKLNGLVDQNIFEGAAAEIVQQQVDLLDGLLISDIGLEIIPKFDKAPKKQQMEVIEWWLNSLKEKGIALNDEITKDEKLLQVKKAIDFMSGVASGDIKLEKVELEKEND